MRISILTFLLLHTFFSYGQNNIYYYYTVHGQFPMPFISDNNLQFNAQGLVLRGTLAENMEIDGMIYEGGKIIRFNNNGMIVEGTLHQDYCLNVAGQRIGFCKEFKAGHVKYNDDGYLIEGILRSAYIFNKTDGNEQVCKEGTTITLNDEGFLINFENPTIAGPKIYTPNICVGCKGNGYCAACGGSGYGEIDPSKCPPRIICGAPQCEKCHGTGKCKVCNGTGKR